MDISVPGFHAAGISSGIKENKKNDLGLLFSVQPASIAAVFTTNKVQAAPVVVTREKVANKNAQAVIVNSGNANACTGEQGFQDAEMMCQLTARELGVDEKSVMVSSTGIIGVPLPMEKIKSSIPRLVTSLSPAGFNDFAEAIMTTDTFPKVVLKKCMVNGKEVTLCGVVKGSGMIMPCMATLLSFIVTDADIDSVTLEEVFRDAVNNSLNRITIDGETSTNDMAIMMANGKAGNSILSKHSSDLKLFSSTLTSLLSELGSLVLKDAEGSTKIISIHVKGAMNDEEARKIAYRIANSNLVKTAFFGEDVNWGRIMSAIGQADISSLPDKIDILFDDVIIVENSTSTGNELRAMDIVKKTEFQVTINLHSGSGFAEVGTTDLTTEYVKINASYPT